MNNSLSKATRFQTFNIDYQLVLLYRIALLLLLFTISRLGFYFFNTEHFSDLTLDRFIRIMFGGLKFDVSGIFLINIGYVGLYHIPFSGREKSKYKAFLKWLFIVSNGIALALNTADFFYFDFILKRSTADVFMFAKESNILNLFKLFFIDYWYGVVFWLVQLFVLIWGYNKTNCRENRPVKGWRYYVSASAWLLLSIYFSVIGIRGGFTATTRPITLGNAGVYTQKPIEMALVLNTPFTIIKTVDKQPLQEKKYFEHEILETIYSPVHKLDSAGEFKPLNVVVLIMESFAKEYVGAFNRNLDNGKYEGYTPFLDSLIDVSKSFQYSFANGRKSIDALPSILASIPYMVHPFVTSVYAVNEINSIASLLNTKGYETAFFHGAPNGSMGFDSFVKIAGYKKYFGMTEYGNDADFDGSWGIWDEEYLLYMADEINNFEEPFHTAFFSISSHHPYKVPKRYEGQFKEGTLDYHIPIQYSDLALQKFFTRASQEPWFNNTLFVLTADHSNKAWHPEYKTSTGYFSVPILFYHPGNPELNGLDSIVAQQTDIMPTVLNYLNYDESYIAFGINILDSTKNSFAANYNNNTYQYIQGQYVLQVSDEKKIGFYNYVKDPLQLNNLLGEKQEIEDDLEQKLKAFIQQYNSRMINNELRLKE